MDPSRRPRALTDFLDATHRAIRARAKPGSAPCVVATRIFSALDESTGPHEPRSRATLPACEHFDAALAMASNGPAPVARLSEAFGALEPLLTWRRRAGADEHGAPFVDGHANVYIVGPDALERRNDVLIGASLLAPHVRYPDHSHPPEEVYVVLSPGEWFGDPPGWHTPGVGGLVHNAPGVTHAMRSGGSALLAVWCLWVGR